jgi:hypothetical protein
VFGPDAAEMDLREYASSLSADTRLFLKIVGDIISFRLLLDRIICIDHFRSFSTISAICGHYDCRKTPYAGTPIQRKIRNIRGQSAALDFKRALSPETQTQKTESRDRFVRQILPSVSQAYHHRKHVIEGQHIGTGKMTDYRAAFGAWIGHNLIHHDL